VSSTLAGVGNHGCRSCAHWLNWRVGMQLGRGARARSVAALARFATGGCARAGRLSYFQGASADSALPRPRLKNSCSPSAGRTGVPRRADRPRWPSRRSPGRGAEDTRRYKRGLLHVYQNDDGMVRIRGRLTPSRARCSCRRWPRRARTLYSEQERPSWPEDVPEETPRWSSCS